VDTESLILIFPATKFEVMLFIVTIPNNFLQIKESGACVARHIVWELYAGKLRRLSSGKSARFFIQTLATCRFYHFSCVDNAER